MLPQESSADPHALTLHLKMLGDLGGQTQACFFNDEWLYMLQETNFWALERGDFGPMEGLLLKGVLLQLDVLIASAVEAEEPPLLTLRALAPLFGVQEATLRQWVTRGKLISVKCSGRLMSHARLLVEPATAAALQT